MSTMTDTKICDRHDGIWGDDETCERCTFEDGSARPVSEPGPLGAGSQDTERYEGYANRETWAFNLHWSNNEGMYRSTLEYATGLFEDEDGEPVTISDREVGESVVAYWRDMFDGYDMDDTPMSRELRMFEREVGSWWRIDYAEVGAAVREALDIED